MSLLVWLPLNGSLINNGLNNIVTLNTPTFIDSIFGKGLSLSPRISYSNLQRLNKFTILFWVKVDSCSVDWADVIGFTSKQKDGTSASEFRFEATKTTRACSFHNNSPYAISTASRILITEQQKGTWHNVGVTYDGKTLCSYIDGEKVYTDTGLKGYLIDTFHIGETNNMVGVMNDLRIYDDVLSLEQIKEISRGLVLHYPLNSGYGNENLIIGSGKYTKNTPLVRTRNAVDGWQKESTLYTDTIEAGTYTLQAKTDGNWHNHSTPSGGYSPDLKYCSIWLVSDAANNESGKDINICLGQTVPKSIVLSYKGKYWIRTNLYSNGTDNLTINFWDFKLEKGEKCSLWSPNKNDALYSTLGYNSTTMYDTSGFGNNAEKINTPIYTSDTALYDSCINFNQSGYLKNTSLNLYANELTICFWVKMPNTIITQHFLFSTHNDWTHNGVGMWRDNSTEKGYYLLIKSNTETTFSRPFIGIDANTWTFISISYTGKQYSVYKNGSLYQTVDYGNNGQVYNPVLYLGNSLYNGTPSTETDEALMSDFRIYATALSAEDIKQLYQTKAKIDKNGNVYCNQFIESNNIGNLLDDYQYPVNSTTHSGVFSKVLVDCQDSITGKATKMACNTAGLGFYIGGCWNTARSKFVNGKQYIWSMYVKSDNRTSITFNVECSSKQSKNTFVIDTNYRRIESVFTYSNSTAYSAFTCYSNFKVDENLYIHTFSVDEYNPKTNVDKKGILHTNSLIEIKSEEKCKIYKQDIQSNEIIEI